MPFKLGQRPALDGLRGVSILWVIAFHFRDADHALPTRGGFLSVDVFFVLSGFLITALLLEEYHASGSIRFGAFYARRALRLLPALFVVVAVPIIRLLQWDGPGSVNRLYFSTQTRADTLLAGCLLALLLSNGYIRGRASEIIRRFVPLAFAFSAFSLVFAYHLSPWIYKGGYTIFAVSTAIVLWAILERGFLRRLLESKPLLWVGRRSYGLYLWHWPIFNAALDHWGHAKVAGPVALPLTFLCAWASYRWIEMPFLRLKRKFSRARAPVDEVVTAPAILEPA